MDFIARSTEKIRAAAKAREDHRLSFAIQAEGGIWPERVEELIRAGADILVVGSAIFSSDDPKARLRECVRTAAQTGRTTVV
jgi:ribulose-phosphate 3-epimerase